MEKQKPMAKRTRQNRKSIQVFSWRIPGELANWLKSQAEKEGIQVSDLLNRIMTERKGGA